MSETGFVFANLWRKKLRTILLIVSVLMAFLIFGVLGSFEEAYTRSTDGATDNRLITANRISFTQPMPAAYVKRIERIDGVAAAAGSSWLGGYYREPRNSIVALAVDPASFLKVYASQITVPDGQRDAFVRNRSTMLVGRSLADANGWRVGQRVPIGSVFYANSATGGRVWDLEIAGIFEPVTPYADTNYLIFQEQYFNETAAFARDRVTWISVLTTSAARNDEVAGAIDRAFRNSEAETNTDTEQAFNRAFAAQFGDLVLIVRLVVGAAMVTILMIVGNTLITAIRQRRREIAILKTLGFTPRRIIRIVLGESLLIVTLGGTLGFLCALPVLAGLRQSLMSIAPQIGLTPAVLLQGAGLMLVIGLVTGLVPAINALRLNPAAAFRRD